MRDFLRRLVLAMGVRPSYVTAVRYSGRHHADNAGRQSTSAAKLVADLAAERGPRTTAGRASRRNAATLTEPASMARPVTLPTRAPEGYASPFPLQLASPRPVTALTPPDLAWRLSPTTRPARLAVLAGQHAGRHAAVAA